MKIIKENLPLRPSRIQWHLFKGNVPKKSMDLYIDSAMDHAENDPKHPTISPSHCVN